MRTGIRTGIAAIAAALALAGTAEARTYEVNKTRDPTPGPCTRSHCSLREAVQAANGRPGADTILLPSRRRDYRLTIPGDTADDARDGDLDVVNGPLAIRHPGRGRARIRGIELADRLFDVFDGGSLRLTKLRLTGGAVPPSDGNGGAIRTAGPLAIRRSVISGNRTDETGGAIYQIDAKLTIVASRISGNRAQDEAGAIEALGGQLVIKRSVFRNNTAADSRAGAIYSWTNSTRIDRSTFAGNRAPTTGGALYVNNGPVKVTNSTFSGNAVLDSDGGAIFSFGELDVRNSTFSGNRATGDGGAIASGVMATTSLRSVTVARNVSNSDADLSGGAGGGVFNSPSATTTIANSILALNDQRGGDANDCAGSFSSLGGNLRSDATDCPGFTGPGDVVRTQPKLGQLRRNGGPTLTIALRRGSPAIGRAVRSISPGRDQRGRRRDRDPDAGAFERGA